MWNLEVCNLEVNTALTGHRKFRITARMLARPKVIMGFAGAGARPAAIPETRTRDTPFLAVTFAGNYAMKN